MKLTSRGFTLVELMIVIAIIGILAAALFPSMTGYLKRSRDTARISGIKDITSAIGAYYADTENYPAGATTAQNCVNSGSLNTNYLPKGVPVDPQTRTAGINGCTTSTNAYSYGSGTSPTAFYTVGASMENTNGGNTLTGVYNWIGNVLATSTVVQQAANNRGSSSGYILTN